MTHKIEAIFENGVFRPLQPLPHLAEHCHVEISVDVPGGNDGTVFRGPGILPDEDAAEMLRIIEQEFEQVDEREWS
jgi:predicted DNA-binding antitoxin AbrB/MazE fold protein